MDPARGPASSPRSIHDPVHDVLGEAGGLDVMFHPRTVAVVGPTAKPDSLGYRTLAALTGCHFDGEVVNVTSCGQDQVLGIPVYPNLNDLPAAPDLAVVVTPDDGVCDAVGQCARAGVTGVVVISGARRPRDAGAADVERRLREELRYGRMRLIGPGCCALMNPASGLNVSPGLPMPVAGSVAFLAQSGSLSATILDWARRGIVGSARSCRWVRSSTSAGGISSTTSAAIRTPAASSSTWSRSSTFDRFCPPRAGCVAEADPRRQGRTYGGCRAHARLVREQPRQRR